MPEILPENRDEQLLDELFRRFVDGLSTGKSIDLAGALPGRPDLAAEVRELYDLAKTVAVTRANEMPRVPGYDLLCEIGRGGMSAVYLAVDLKLGRRVALKVMTGARFVGAHGRERFRREVGAIARLSHPSIVKVYEAGEADGVPFFTMEHIEGCSLAEVVRGLRRLGKPVATLTGADFGRHVLGPDAAELPAVWRGTYVEAVCRLVAEVADALQHAHEHGVVHRDVKPSNVIVRRDGHALLFDFGLARVADEASLTLSGDFVGTPYYASPEQLDRKRRQADARSDVYSLGATLYELLTLAVPFPGESTHEVLRRILAREAPSPRRANAQIPRDLETIVLESLEKEPARRYASAADLAADLRRLLAFQPILARPSGAASRTFKWVRRNRATAAALVLGVLLVVGLPTALLVQEKIASRAVQRQVDRVEAMNTFLLGLIGAVDPAKSGYEARIADTLHEASERIDTEFAAQPDIQLTLRDTIAGMLYKLGLHKEALPLYERVLEAVTASGGARSQHTIELLNQIGSCQCKLSMFEEARATIARAVELAEAELGPTHPLTLSVRYERTRIANDSGHPRAAETERKELVELRAREPGDNRLATAREKAGLAIAVLERGDYEAGRKLLEEALPILEQNSAPDHPDVLTARHNLAGALFGLARSQEALVILQDVLAKRRLKIGRRTIDTIETLALIANVHEGIGEFDQAMQEIDEALGDAAGLDPSNRTLLDLHFKRGMYRLGRRDFSGAKEDLEPTAKQLEALQGRGGLNAVQARILLLRALFGMGELEEAERLYREEHEWCKSALGPEDSNRWILQSDYGVVLLARDHAAEAEALLVESEERLSRFQGMAGILRSTRRALAAHYQARGDLELAAWYRDGAPASRPKPDSRPQTASRK